MFFICSFQQILFLLTRHQIIFMALHLMDIDSWVFFKLISYTRN